MVVIERKSGQGVHIGPYTLRVLEVRPGRVVLVLDDADADDDRGGPPGSRRPAGRADRRAFVVASDAGAAAPAK